LSAQATQAKDGGELLKAAQLYKKGVEIQPAWAEGWWFLGTLSYDLDLYEDGRDAFRRFVALQSDSAPAWALLGLCEYQTKEYDRSLASLNKAKQLGMALGSQMYYVASYHAALLLSRRGDFEVAMDTLQKLALNHPQNQKLIEAFGIAILRLPFLPTEVPPDRREAILLAGQAGNCWATSRLEEAGKYYDELVQRYPSMPNTHYARGVYKLLTDPDAAVAEFRKELELSNAHLQARLQLAFEYL